MFTFNYFMGMCYLFIIVGVVFLVIGFIFKRKIANKLDKNNRNPSYCILIPAKNESKVIKSPLESLKKQSMSVNMKNVYVIVEDKNDLTCNIVKKYGANIFVRKNLNNNRKGFALDECIKHLINNDKYYDVCFIIDADNILDRNFIKEMLDSYINGYDIAVSRRDSSNANESIVAGASTITFEMINTINSTKKNVVITGTGFYISGDYIFNKWKGYPFCSLTEDYEMTLYSIKNNIKAYYNENAIIYDEQPINIKSSVKQRTRWVSGFLEAREKYINFNDYSFNDIMGITPYILIIFGFFLSLLTMLYFSIYNLIIGKNIWTHYLWLFFQTICLVYLLLLLFTLIIMIINNKKITMSFNMKIKVLFYHPIFLTTYILCLLKAIKGDVSWDSIEHHNNNKIFK